MLKYRFDCGCTLDHENVLFDYVHVKGGRKHPICPEHRGRITAKIILCKACGEWEEVSKKASHVIVCSACREEHNKKTRQTRFKRQRPGKIRQRQVMPKKITGEPKEVIDRLAFLDRRKLKMPKIEDYPGLARIVSQMT